MEPTAEIARTLPQTLPALVKLFMLQGRSEAELEKIIDAHRLAMDIFSGQYRPSGKSFTCHCVGVGAALAVAGGRIDLVVAGLLHAAYTCGDWGDKLPTMEASKRAKLRARVGAEAEDLIARYTELEWYTVPVEQIRFEELDRPGRDTLALRLANEVDENLDGGILYATVGEHKRQLAERSLPLWLRFAHELGYPALADLLSASVGDMLATELPKVAKTRRRVSYLIPPASYTKKPSAFLRQKAYGGSLRAKRLAERVRATLRGDA